MTKSGPTTIERVNTIHEAVLVVMPHLIAYQSFSKINLDAAFNPETKSAGWGCIVRDENGMFMAAGAGKLGLLHRVFHAETEAISRAIQMPTELGMGHIVPEVDAVNLVSALNTAEYDRSDVVTLIVDLKFLLTSPFVQYKVTKCVSLY